MKATPFPVTEPRRFERDVADDWTRVTGGASSWQNTDGVLFRPSSTASYDLWIDDIRLSNALTVEHNMLGTGVIGHILRHRTIDVPGAGGAGLYATTDRWFHYDQVGSVLSQTDSSGTVAATFWQDAFGNQLQSWTTGLWSDATAQSGWHHNTKEYDADAGMAYMYHRWYIPALGSFSSNAPLPPFREHPFSFALGNPLRYVDARGEFADELPSGGSSETCGYTPHGEPIMCDDLPSFPKPIATPSSGGCGDPLFDLAVRIWPKIKKGSAVFYEAFSATNPMLPGFNIPLPLYMRPAAKEAAAAGPQGIPLNLDRVTGSLLGGAFGYFSGGNPFPAVFFGTLLNDALVSNIYSRGCALGDAYGEIEKEFNSKE